MRVTLLRFARALVGLAVATGPACIHEPPVDPRAADRARLDDVAKTPLPPDFPAEARLVLSPRLMAVEVQQSLDDAARAVESFRFALPLLGEIALRPSLTVRAVRAEPEPSCTGCVALIVDLEGVLAPVTASGLLPGLRFSGAARGVFALTTLDVPDANVVEVRAIGADGTDAAGRHGWSARLELVDLPPGVSSRVSQSVTDFLQRLMTGETRPDLLLASLPREGPVRLRGLRPSAQNGAVVVDVAFVAIDAGVVSDALPPVEEGFALQLPEQTLLALARAETLRMAPEDGWVVDPTRVVVDGDRFALDLAVYKLAGAVERRDVRVDGALQIDGTKLAITPTSATQLGRSGGFDPFELVVRTALLQKVEESLRLTVPVAQAAPVGGHTRRVRLVGVRDLGPILQVNGVVDAPAGR